MEADAKRARTEAARPVVGGPTEPQDMREAAHWPADILKGLDNVNPSQQLINPPVTS